jgi:hypothetical protein
MNQVMVIVIQDNVVHESWLCKDSEAAEKKFREICTKFIGSSMLLDEEGWDEAIENGYMLKGKGDGSVCIHWF